MATDQINCIHTDNNVMYVLLSYLCHHSKLCCQQKLSRLRIKHCFHKRRRQQHLYFKTCACTQRLRKVYYHWSLRSNSCITVNKVKGNEKEIFANYWRLKSPNGPCQGGKRQTKIRFSSTHAFLSVVLQYHTRVLYSFEVDIHKLGHPFKAVSST